MKLKSVSHFRILACLTAVFGFLAAVPLQAQADATASRGLEISVFGGPAGVFTGLAGGHNVSFSAGVDIGFRPLYGFLPAVEARGLYPIADGTVDSQKNVLGGLRFERPRRNLRLYGDVLFGRGELNYLNGGYLNADGSYRYVTSTSNVYSLGGGVSYDLPRGFGIVADVQFQHYNTPFASPGIASNSTDPSSIWSKPITIGVVYRLPALKHGHPYP